jgi:hypothetical protein
VLTISPLPDIKGIHVLRKRVKGGRREEEGRGEKGKRREERGE